MEVLLASYFEVVQRASHGSMTHSLTPPAPVRSGLVWSTTSTATQMVHLWMALENMLQRVSDSSQGSVSQDVAAFMLASLVNKGFGFFWKCFSFARQVLHITKVSESWDDDVTMMGSRTMTVALWVLDVDWRSDGTNWSKTLETSRKHVRRLHWESWITGWTIQSSLLLKTLEFRHFEANYCTDSWRRSLFLTHYPKNWPSVVAIVSHTRTVWVLLMSGRPERSTGCVERTDSSLGLCWVCQVQHWLVVAGKVTPKQHCFFLFEPLQQQIEATAQ